MKIRRATRYSKKLMEAILQLLPQLDVNLKLPDEDHIKRVLSNRNTILLVSESENGEISGMLTMASYSIPSGTKYWIDDVIVDEGHRGMKIGRDLLISAIEEARKRGAVSVDLTSRPFRVAANQLYLDLGFARRETNVYRYSF